MFGRAPLPLATIDVPTDAWVGVAINMFVAALDFGERAGMGIGVLSKDVLAADDRLADVVIRIETLNGVMAAPGIVPEIAPVSCAVDVVPCAGAEALLNVDIRTGVDVLIDLLAGVATAILASVMTALESKKLTPEEAIDTFPFR